jgi:hypothetical protein
MSNWGRAGDQRACRVDDDDFGTLRRAIHATGSVVIAYLVHWGPGSSASPHRSHLAFDW